MKHALFCCAVACAALAAQLHADEATPPAAAERDGSHDFDFNLGVWKTHIVRQAHPLSNSNETIKIDGVVHVRPVWNGRAQVEEIEADGPHGHWEGLTLFTYNPVAHQWVQTFLNSQSGRFGGDSLMGAFHDGRAELFATDTVDGRAVLVRGTWSGITPTAHRYEEAYSTDGGKTWEVEFTGDLTKASEADLPTVSNTDGSHEFDFDFGTWKTHSSRLMHPLTGASDWRDMDGLTVVTPLWGGRANLAEFKGTGPAGTVELIALRVYNPTTKQWSINFTHPGTGLWGDAPGIGEFKNGRVDFYDQEPINGKAVLVRFSMWGITKDTAQSEQAFSTDGGKTWEVNWVNKYTRAPEKPAGG